jgi:2,4-dienoyl-CoA reductase-like NADH-dependent reductase (Old Yellow Enzyme family)
MNGMADVVRAPTDALFKPFKLGPIDLPNRVVMSPMGRLFCEDGVLAAGYPEYYRRRVEGETYLITGEAAGIDPVSLSIPEAPFFFGDRALRAWADVSNAVRDAGGHFMPQLWHAGMGREPGTGPFPEKPSLSVSGLFIPHVGADLKPKPERSVAEPLLKAGIDAVVEAFGEAAFQARKMGCSGVNVHGAHGYLIDQFLWTRSNRRGDDYGGSLANRVRFACEVIAEIRRRTSPDFPIVLRLSQWKTQDYEAKIAETPSELEQILSPLVDAGVDLFDCSTRRFWEPEFPRSDLNLAGWAKKLSGKPSMTVGSVGLEGAFMTATDEGHGEYVNESTSEQTERSAPASLDRLVERLEREEFDLVAVGRALIANPDWTALIRTGDYEKLRPYNRRLLLALE